MRWIENEELFATQLARGHKWQTIVGVRLLQEGLVVQVAPYKLRERIEDIEDFTKHDIDILVGRIRPVPIEVKSRNFAFTKPEDYPYDDAMVGTVSSWEQTETQPEVVVLVSTVTSAMLAVNVESSRVDWTVVEKFDRDRGIVDRSYCCPVEHLRPFYKLVDWLKGRKEEET
jgi:hypothetical protein